MRLCNTGGARGIGKTRALRVA